MNRLSSIISLIFLCIVWGTTFHGIKISLQGIPPFWGATFRFIVASVIILLYMWIRKIKPVMNRKQFRMIVITGFLIYVIDYGFLYWGEIHLSGGVAAIFFSTFTLFTTFWANVVFRFEPFQWQKFWGIIGGFIGTVIVFMDQLIITHFNAMVILASLAVIISAAGGALSSVLIKKHLSDMDTYTLTLSQMIVGVVFLAQFGLVLERTGSIKISLPVALAVLYLGLIGSAIAFILYFKLLKQMSVVSLSLIIYITPLVALLIDFLFVGQRLEWRSVAGICVIFSGIWLSQQKKIPFTS